MEALIWVINYSLGFDLLVRAWLECFLGEVLCGVPGRLAASYTVGVGQYSGECPGSHPEVRCG